MELATALVATIVCDSAVAGVSSKPRTTCRILPIYGLYLIMINTYTYKYSLYRPMWFSTKLPPEPLEVQARAQPGWLPCQFVLSVDIPKVIRRQ